MARLPGAPLELGLADLLEGLLKLLSDWLLLLRHLAAGLARLGAELGARVGERAAKSGRGEL